MLKKIFLFLCLTFFEIHLAQNINVQPVNKEQLSKLIKERNGKVLLLNLWATWCIPCREEFPDLIRIVNEFKNNYAEVVGISIDFQDEVQSKIIPFLKKQKVNFKNYVNGFDNDEQLINMISKKWNGALPTTIIYDSTGKQVSFLEGKRTYQEFKNELDKIIKLESSALK
jgi:thiol-disulfide isomerase/thioredoxin